MVQTNPTYTFENTRYKPKMGVVNPDRTLLSGYPEGEQKCSLTFLRTAAEVGL